VATGRVRAFEEYDPYKDVSFGEGPELSYEESFALMGSPWGNEKKRLWIYGEFTLEGSSDPGITEKLPRAGLIFENLLPGITIDLDFYYSLMDSAAGGPGILGVIFWAPDP
jgi:hypothetical protein